MQDILTVTLNPALDISTYADDIRPGPKLRCAPPRADAGGGGLNVSRAIAYLGGHSRALAAIGGGVGLRLASLLQHEGIDLIPFHIDSETRESLSITDRTDGQQFRFVLPGPTWEPGRVEQVQTTIATAIEGPTLLVVSGSNPPGVSPDFIGGLVDHLAGRDCRIIADASGPALRWLRNNPCGVYMLRMDAAEAQELAESPLTSRSETADFAKNLVHKGVADLVIIARGADGSVLSDGHSQHHCSCKVSTVRSKVGAGDSFVAGMVLALAQGAGTAQALRHGVAAASAAVITEATELCRHDDVLRLLDQCELSDL